MPAGYSREDFLDPLRKDTAHDGTDDDPIPHSTADTFDLTCERWRSVDDDSTEDVYLRHDKNFSYEFLGLFLFF